ncbi:hypothetical protein Tco_1050198 [Tanacetum coccineum]
MEVLKNEFSKKQEKYIEEIVDLEKKKKAIDNIVYKTNQTAQTMHMFTKPQFFYDKAHKIALGYQNPLYLTQAQRKQRALYCGHTIVRKHDALSMNDTEETLKLDEESKLKMLAKQNDLIAQEKKTKVSGQNEGTWGFEHIWRAFEKDVKAFVKTLREYFQMFDQCLAKEITDMKEVFTQMEIKVETCFVERKYFEIKKKELFIENDRLLEHIICQDVICIAMHADFENNCVLHANEDNLEYA